MTTPTLREAAEALLAAWDDRPSMTDSMPRLRGHIDAIRTAAATPTQVKCGRSRWVDDDHQEICALSDEHVGAHEYTPETPTPEQPLRPLTVSAEGAATAVELMEKPGEPNEHLSAAMAALKIPEQPDTDVMEVAKEIALRFYVTPEEGRDIEDACARSDSVRTLAAYLVPALTAATEAERERVMWWFDEMVHRIRWADDDAEHMSVLRDRLASGNPRGTDQ